MAERLGKGIGMGCKRVQVMGEAWHKLSKTQEECASGSKIQEGCREGV